MSTKLDQLTQDKSLALNSQDTEIYIHPALSQTELPQKGRALVVAAPVPAGTMLIADTPYALIPIVPPDRKEEGIICSNLICRARVPQDGNAVYCPRACMSAVLWCNAHCWDIDQARHNFECAWLDTYGNRIRQKEGQSDFVLLWVVVRMLAARVLELNATAEIDHYQKKREEYSSFPWEDRFERHWVAVESMRSNREQWPPTKIEHWRNLVTEYLSDDQLLPGLLPADEMLNLIFKAIVNTYDLYDVPTGPASIQQKQGPAYGLGVYPRATWVNHSCVPNIQHGPDASGRIILTTMKDLAAGEECFISYFNLTVYTDLKARQQRTMDLFTFISSIAVTLSLLAYGFHRIPLTSSTDSIWTSGLATVDIRTINWPSSLIIITLIANTPQLIFSALYFTLNSI
ncbi:hypothetical protein BDW74DRAFT_177737 [Aspergillus multicolor]|uniref:uncharacterized protein n=1 Tax=Aspergillus multicolor TaxID=41759 RepID=UPI003CCCF0C5